MSKNMVERVAAAIESRLEGVIAEAVQNMGDTGPYSNDWREAARAAIEAMRSPTEAMVEAYDRFCDDVCFPSIPAEQALSVMIDAALKP